MLGEATIFTTIAVSDLAAAKAFYGETLGLKQTDENPAGITYQSGNGRLFVYPSGTAGTNQATCAAWEVTDVRAAVDELKSKGITFETYDLPGAVWDGEIASFNDGQMQTAWFRDPDGNILAIG